LLIRELDRQGQLQQGVLESSSSGAEVSTSQYITGFDLNNGVELGTDAGVNQSGTGFINWSWKRAPGFFDVVAYSGNSTAGRTVSHNLGVVPEMMWVKSRSKDEDWVVYHEGLGSPPEENYIYLNHNRVKNFDGNTIRLWNHTSPTDSEFTLGIESRVNLTGHTPTSSPQSPAYPRWGATRGTAQVRLSTVALRQVLGLFLSSVLIVQVTGMYMIQKEVLLQEMTAECH
jgi:hypothetical protein